MRNQLLATPSRVNAFRQHALPEFDSIFDFVQKSNFRIDLNYTYIAERLPQLDKIYWKSKRPLIPLSRFQKKSKINGHEIIHHGIHYALIQNFTTSLVKFPLFVLLSESIASCSDLYFLATYLNLKGVEHPIVKELIQPIRRTCKRLKIPFIKTMSSACVDPWTSFKESTETMFEVLCFILKISKNSRHKPYYFKKKLNQLLFKSKYYGVIASYDLHLFVAYAHFHCGGKSWSQDFKIVKKCLSDLRTSKSMMQFLDKIGIKPLA